MERQKILAWLVHLYTASGAVWSAWAIFAIIAGDYRRAWMLLFVTIFIDSTDGFLARQAAVKAVLPWFDGRRLDDIVDYLAWVFVPVILLVQANLLPAWAAAAPLIASGYGFAQAEAKTDDHYFLGFPSYWSLVAFFLFEAMTPVPLNTIIILVLSVLVFVPIRYPYPTQMSSLRELTLLLGIPWAILSVYLAAQLPARPFWLIVGWCYYPLYYLLLTCYMAWQRHRSGNSARTTGP